jgi:hypothetical protein
VTTADLLLFAFSLLGLFLAPAALGRAVWALPAALAGAALFILFAPAPLHPFFNPWVHVLLSQGPWMLLVLDLAFQGRISRLLGPVPVRALLAFSLFRFMGLRFIFSAITGEMAPDFAVEAAIGEFFAAFGALGLWAAYPKGRPPGRWYRGLLVFWNTYAMVTSVALSYRVLRADPGLPLGLARPSREVHAYFSTWPHALDAYVWIPLAIGIHAAIFFALAREAKRT